MSTLKEHKKIARFYGANALTGTKRQKEWAESIRAGVLKSTALTDDEKADFVTAGKLVTTAKFWINNKDLRACYFTEENIVREVQALNEVRHNYYDILARSGPTGPKEKAKEEIIKVLTENKFQLGPSFSFPNFEPYDCWGVFKK